MVFSLSISALVILIGIAQGLFLSVLLLSIRAKNRFANRVLAALVWLATVDLCLWLVGDTDYLFKRVGGLGLLSNVCDLAYGPLIYIYILAVTDETWSALKKRILLVLIPAIVMFTLLLPYSLRLDIQAYLSFISGDAIGVSNNEQLAYQLLKILVIISSLITFVQTPFYLFYAFGRFRLHDTKVETQRSLKEPVSLYGLRHFILGFCFLYLGYFFDVASIYLFDVDIGDFIFIALTFSIFGMGYMGMRQLDLVSDFYHEYHQTVEHENTKGTKYQNSALDAESTTKLFEQLSHYMDNHKPYLQGDISLSQLSKDMGLSTNYLSQIINQRTQGNFFEFINQYRIEHAMNLLSQPELNQTILEIALESGFNSKSTFYSVFKNKAGCTPSQYIKSQT